MTAPIDFDDINTAALAIADRTAADAKPWVKGQNY